jgi:hypothetical protein
MESDLVDALRFGMKTIVAKFICDIKNDQHAGCNTGSHSQNVDRREELVLHNVTDGEFEIVFIHNKSIVAV